MNFGVANVKWLNNLLRQVFVAEVSKLRRFNYPWGISVMAVMVKP
jgi:hypothetical protein